MTLKRKDSSPPSVEASGFGFTPLIVPPEDPAQTYEKVKAEVGVMETARTWLENIKILGQANAEYIEGILDAGGTVADIGAGGLISAYDLAEKYGDKGGAVVAVEPFTPSLIEEVPENMRVVRKLIEEVTDIDIEPNSVDAAYCSNVFGYPPDKLEFIKGIYRILKVGGSMIIPDKGGATNPALVDIFKMAGLSHLIEMQERNALGFGVAVIKKESEQLLNFGEYTFSIANRGGQETSTTYEFTNE